MAKKRSKNTSNTRGAIEGRLGNAPKHDELKDNLVHVFIDDQNLFYGIINKNNNKSYRMDFGRLLLEVSKDDSGNTRGVSSAYIAGVIPDDDSFWEAAKNQGFEVHRGYLGANNRSKQDDAFLIAEMVDTLRVKNGPSTIVLVAGDADYVPALMKTRQAGWRNEVAFINQSVSVALDAHVHQFRVLSEGAIELL